MTIAEPLLQLEHIDASYATAQVLFDLSLHVHAGEIVCLLGGNASGKSTTMKVILGLVKPRAGNICFDGREITNVPTPRIIGLGIGSVPEARRIFPDMTVRENLLMGAYLRHDTQEVAHDYESILDMFPRLKERLSRRGGVLSGGEQQMLAFGRALMSRPRLICMDEPTMGLAPLFVERTLQTIETIHSRGIAVFIVEQNANLALRIAQRGYVLQNGHIVLEGAASDLLNSPEIQDAYLGENRA